VLGLAAIGGYQPRVAAQDQGPFAQAFAEASQLPRLQALVVAQHGVILAEQRFRGPSLDTPVNIKSVSKSIISALVGIAIARGKLRGVDQPIAPFFPVELPKQRDPRIDHITLGHLLSMQSGLVRTSGPSYGSWISSRNWLQYILRAPLLADPGGPMIYSTGNTHLLSAILTRAMRESTLSFARRALFKPLGISLQPWVRDPQGIFMGGNEMRLSAHELLRFGELYRLRGRYKDQQVVPESWIDAAWTPRTTSIFSGQAYGYGWFVAEVDARRLYFAWGYGGQFIFIMPELELTVVTTSQSTGPRDFEHLGEIFRIFRERIVPALPKG
jgi:CubicO group peptidase (beta-lactamase class C family)